MLAPMQRRDPAEHQLAVQIAPTVARVDPLALGAHNAAIGQGVPVAECRPIAGVTEHKGLAFEIGRAHDEWHIARCHVVNGRLVELADRDALNLNLVSLGCGF